ncbi:MAG: ribosome-associated translation inhibitor RaiA [Deltaproteobacteria bacterium]|nr:ribosome-associated translation inhibitor RaiA [Deltaproteobacteria bacterium]
MRVAVTFRNLDSSDAIKGYAQDKLGKLQKYLRAPIDAQVTASVENKHRHCVEVLLAAGGETYKGREESEDMYASIDLVMDKLERQITRSHGRTTARRRDASVAAIEASATPVPEGGAEPPAVGTEE